MFSTNAPIGFDRLKTENAGSETLARQEMLRKAGKRTKLQGTFAS
jgi:hypothetical protein